MDVGLLGDGFYGQCMIDQILSQWYIQRVCRPHLFAMLGNDPSRILSSFNCDLSGNHGMKLELETY